MGPSKYYLIGCIVTVILLLCMPCHSLKCSGCIKDIEYYMYSGYNIGIDSVLEVLASEKFTYDEKVKLIESLKKDIKSQ